MSEEKEQIIRDAKHPCRMCGKPEKHYVHPSLGEPGFYICETAGNGESSGEPSE